MRRTTSVALLAVALASAGCEASLTGAEAGFDTGAAGGSHVAGSPGAGEAPAFEPLGGTEPVVCDPAQTSLGGRRIWRLTRAQYENTVSTLLDDASRPARDFTPEPGSDQGFQNDAFGLRVRGAEAGQFKAAARRLAAAAVAEKPALIAACVAENLEDPGCGSALVAEFGAKAFRRPVTDSEQARYLELFRMGAQKGGGKLGAEVVVEAMLQSPYFLYRFELGGPPLAGQVALTGHELASLLSYTFTAGPPDAELDRLAQDGTLSEPPTLEQQARRLLSTSAARGALSELYHELFELTLLADLPKDETLFPEFDGMREDLAASARAFTEHVLFDGAGTLTELFTSDTAFVTPAIAPLFGTTSSKAELVQVTLAAGQRAGLLAHPGVMSVLSARTRTSPVNRGRFVRERLLCHDVPDAPADIDTTLPELAPGLTARQQLDAKTAAPNCAGCHSLMNDLGFGFEKLDALGRLRSEEAGVPIDDSAVLEQTRDIDGPFQGAFELAQKLSTSSQVSECLAIQAFRYTLGRPENRGDACVIADIRDRFQAQSSNLKELIVALSTSEAFRKRAAE
jgi:hypothetical protein